MKIITSIMPTTIEEEIKTQQRAITTWQEAGFEPIACNRIEEIELYKRYFPNVKFIELSRDASKTYKKTYPYIYDLIQLLEGQLQSLDEIGGIVNSDIFFRGFNSEDITAIFEGNTKKLLWMHRYDIDSEEDLSGEYYFSGLDAFFMSKESMGKYKDEGFVMGRPEWDHWMVYMAEDIGLQTLEIRNSAIYHKRHLQRWSAKESNQAVMSKAKEREQLENFTEEYYTQTNKVLSDLSLSVYMKGKAEVNKDSYENLSNIDMVYDPNLYLFLSDKMNYYKVNALAFQPGICYIKNENAYRICAMHGELKEKYSKQCVFKKKGVQGEPLIVGDIMAYVDFKNLSFYNRLGRFYVYTAGRAARLLLDCLNTYGIKPLGVVDSDVTLEGSMCMGHKVYRPSVLESQDEYDKVLIVSNLYSEEIYSKLSSYIQKEKLILL